MCAICQCFKIMNKSNFLTFLLIPTIIGIEINSETIHFTNSPQHLLTRNNFTAYKLNIQGSSEPITIIEANSYDRENQGITSRTLNIDRNDNIVKSTLGLRIIEADNLNEESDVTGDETIVSQKKTVYSPVLLKKFLKDYAERINGASTTMKNKLNELAHIKYSSKTDEDSQSEDKHGSDFDLRKNYHPYNDRDGWVTLEPIPWSSSKVSKWHSNKKPYKPTPWNEYEDKSQEYPLRPKPPQYYDSVEMDDFYDNRPSSTNKPLIYPRPWNTNNYDDDIDRPIYNSPRPQNNNKPPYYDSFYDNFKPQQSHDKPWNDDIISDNRPSDFPDFPPQENKPPIYEKPYYYEQPQHFNTNRRPPPPSLDSYASGSSISHSSVPSTYPANGNGEWVLISTTKGYHNNKRHGKRAVVYNTTNSQGLTVLPENNNFNKVSSAYSGLIEIANSPSYKKQNLNKISTTAYGGLIEVAPSAETLDDTVDKKKIKNASIKRKATIKKIQMSRNSQDSTAMFAAVSAGMVPALVAMAMPMVLGKRKKRDLFNITMTPNDYEDSIPRNYRL